MREDAAGTDDEQLGGVAAGLSTVTVAALGYAALFALSEGRVDTAGTVAVLALAAVGFAQLLAPGLQQRMDRLAPRWTGVFWVAVAVAVAAVGAVALSTASRPGSGILLGAGLALYGCLVAFRG